MPKHFRCPKGHNWEVLSGASSVIETAVPVCPLCGLNHVTFVQVPDAGTIDGEFTIAGLPEPGTPQLPEDLPIIPRYEVLGVLGRGGMGIVYLAKQKSLNRLVALKMVCPEHSVLGAGPERFRNEALAAATLDNPHIVPIYEVGDVDGRPFFSMKLIEGGSLIHRLDRFVAEPRKVAELMVAIGGAVHHAHQRGILHRDLKPSNILMDLDGNPYVADFGLAKRLETPNDLTRTGAIVGTPSYMAPEQALGKKGAITTATDIYGLGAITYTLLTGQPPFQGETSLETLDNVKNFEPVAPSATNRRVDRDLETICLKCLEKEPERRYHTAEALVEDLKRWLAHEPIQARALGLRARLWRWCRRNPSVAGLGLTAAILFCFLVVTGVIGTLIILQRNQERQFALALSAQQEEIAEQQALIAGRGNYVRYMSLAWRLWGTEDFQPARDVLSQLIPRDREKDYRGFEWDYLWRLCGRDLSGPDKPSDDEFVELKGHQGEVYCVAFTPSGRYLVSAGQDHIVRFWNPVTRELVRTIGQESRHDPAKPFHTNEINWFSFSPDGSLLATASEDYSARIWKVDTGAEVARLIRHTNEVVGIAFAPDGKSLATGGRDGLILLWEGPDWRKSTILENRKGWEWESVVFSPDGKTLAALAGDGAVHLWDMEHRQKRAPIKASSSRVLGVAFSPDGRSIATAGSDNLVIVWDAATGLLKAKLRGHRQAVYGLAFSPDGQALVSAGDEGEIRWRALPTGVIRHLYKACSGRIWSLAFSPDGKMLASAGRVAAHHIPPSRSSILACVLSVSYETHLRG